ncbi:hypothetical protein EDI_281680 [Entamoeba dispar SAW760]|uniref:Uncharacterized protein n=1 Tax=Entamoeba dispar (strain ATCC PRA-260 / SAW760) TaxID=370354 RepID=B0EP62_ENTDS|nr:uncharacterized protein EDI_281680 [Entamoeba dispar SAW760]EDR23692.1 hypothetical protein EDI_281680 [Entamoeba dispar SAW760]|eukprot:EDR23692.1 hypothetical protein EDI_281680 [Entamoeba dispar SAW760]
MEKPKKTYQITETNLWIPQRDRVDDFIKQEMKKDTFFMQPKIEDIFNTLNVPPSLTDENWKRTKVVKEYLNGLGLTYETKLAPHIFRYRKQDELKVLGILSEKKAPEYQPIESLLIQSSTNMSYGIYEVDKLKKFKMKGIDGGSLANRSEDVFISRRSMR